MADAITRPYMKKHEHDQWMADIFMAQSDAVLHAIYKRSEFRGCFSAIGDKVFFFLNILSSFF